MNKLIFLAQALSSFARKQQFPSFINIKNKLSWLAICNKNAQLKTLKLIPNSVIQDECRLPLIESKDDSNSSKAQSTLFLMRTTITAQKKYAGLEEPLPLIYNDSDYSDADFQTHLMQLAKGFNRTGDPKPFKNCLLVYNQHYLGTVEVMFRVFKKFGLRYSVGGGKSYSTHQPTAQQIASNGSVVIPEPKPLGYGRYLDVRREHSHLIWQAALRIIDENGTIDRVLVLDDNSGLLQQVPVDLVNKSKNSELAYRGIKLVGIEQTASGTNDSSRISTLPFPVIPFADSVAKAWAEYPEVATIVADKMVMAIKCYLQPLMKADVPITIGVIGCGRMGKAVIENLVRLGFQVKYFDKDSSRRVDTDGAKYIDNEIVLIAGVDAVIDCSGYPMDRKIISAITSHRGPLMLASASSGDSAFSVFLEHLQEVTKQPGQTPDILRDIHWVNDTGSPVIAVRGTFPINFDNQKHCMSPRRSLATRGLTLLSLFDALHIMQHPELLNSTNIYQPWAVGQYQILKTYGCVNADMTHEWTDMPEEILHEKIEKNSWGKPIQINSTPSLAPRR